MSSRKLSTLQNQQLSQQYIQMYASISPEASKNTSGREELCSSNELYKSVDSVNSDHIASTTSILPSDNPSKAIAGTTTINPECRRSSRKKIIKFDVRDLLNKNRKSHKIQIEARIDSNAPASSTAASQSFTGAETAAASFSSPAPTANTDLTTKQKTFIEKAAIFRRYSISAEQQNKSTAIQRLPIPSTTKARESKIPLVSKSGDSKQSETSATDKVKIAQGHRLNRTHEIFNATMMKSKQNSSLIIAQMGSSGSNGSVSNPSIKTPIKPKYAVTPVKFVDDETSLKKTISQDAQPKPQKQRGRPRKIKTDGMIDLVTEKNLTKRLARTTNAGIKQETRKQKTLHPRHTINKTHLSKSLALTPEKAKNWQEYKACLKVNETQPRPKPIFIRDDTDDDDIDGQSTNILEVTSPPLEIAADTNSLNSSTRANSTPNQSNFASVSYIHESLPGFNDNVTSAEFIIAAEEEIVTQQTTEDATNMSSHFNEPIVSSASRIQKSNDELSNSIISNSFSAVESSASRVSNSSGSESEINSDRGHGKSYKEGAKLRVSLRRLSPKVLSDPKVINITRSSPATSACSSSGSSLSSDGNISISYLFKEENSMEKTNAKQELVGVTSERNNTKSITGVIQEKDNKKSKVNDEHSYQQIPVVSETSKEEVKVGNDESMKVSTEKCETEASADDKGDEIIRNEKDKDKKLDEFIATPNETKNVEEISHIKNTKLQNEKIQKNILGELERLEKVEPNELGFAFNSESNIKQQENLSQGNKDFNVIKDTEREECDQVNLRIMEKTCKEAKALQIDQLIIETEKDFDEINNEKDRDELNSTDEEIRNAEEGTKVKLADELKAKDITTEEPKIEEITVEELITQDFEESLNDVMTEKESLKYMKGQSLEKELLNPIASSDLAAEESKDVNAANKILTEYSIQNNLNESSEKDKFDAIPPSSSSSSIVIIPSVPELQLLPMAMNPEIVENDVTLDGNESFHSEMIPFVGSEEIVESEVISADVSETGPLIAIEEVAKPKIQLEQNLCVIEHKSTADLLQEPRKSIKLPPKKQLKHFHIFNDAVKNTELISPQLHNLDKPITDQVINMEAENLLDILNIVQTNECEAVASSKPPKAEVVQECDVTLSQRKIAGRISSPQALTLKRTTTVRRYERRGRRIDEEDSARKTLEETFAEIAAQSSQEILEMFTNRNDSNKSQDSEAENLNEIDEKKLFDKQEENPRQLETGKTNTINEAVEDLIEQNISLSKSEEVIKFQIVENISEQSEEIQSREISTNENSSEKIKQKFITSEQTSPSRSEMCDGSDRKLTNTPTKRGCYQEEESNEILPEILKGKNENYIAITNQATNTNELIIEETNILEGETKTDVSSELEISIKGVADSQESEIFHEKIEEAKKDVFKESSVLLKSNIQSKIDAELKGENSNIRIPDETSNLLDNISSLNHVSDSADSEQCPKETDTPFIENEPINEEGIDSEGIKITKETSTSSLLTEIETPQETISISKNPQIYSPEETNQENMKKEKSENISNSPPKKRYLKAQMATTDEISSQTNKNDTKTEARSSKKKSNKGSPSDTSSKDLIADTEKTKTVSWKKTSNKSKKPTAETKIDSKIYESQEKEKKSSKKATVGKSTRTSVPKIKASENKSKKSDRKVSDSEKTTTSTKSEKPARKKRQKKSQDIFESALNVSLPTTPTSTLTPASTRTPTPVPIPTTPTLTTTPTPTGTSIPTVLPSQNCIPKDVIAQSEDKTMDTTLPTPECSLKQLLSLNSPPEIANNSEPTKVSSTDVTTGLTKIESTQPTVTTSLAIESEEEPDPLKDIEKFIEDGVNLLKHGYKIDDNEDDSVDSSMLNATKKLIKEDLARNPLKDCSALNDQSNLDALSNFVDTPADTPLATPSVTPPPKSPIGVPDIDDPYATSGGVRRSHRIKQNSKAPKALVGRGLVRDKERLSLKDDVETKTHYSIDDHRMDLAEVEAKNTKFLKDMEERLSNFRVIKENEYKCERVISKEAKKMICDCFLTAEEEERGELGCGEDCLNRLLMIECGPDCNVKERCTNKRFQLLLSSPCRVFRTEKKGFGIMADVEILPGEFIMEYVGEVINGDEFERRRIVYSQDKNRHYYFMALRSDAIIDATIKGNISRFINHSCEPNAETQKWTVNGELRIGFFSKKSIMPGEEITFDYQYQRYGREAQRCYCESTNCRGWIGEEPNSDEGEQIGDDSDGDEEEEENLAESLLGDDDEDDSDETDDAEEAQKKLEKAAAEAKLIPIGEQEKDKVEGVLSTSDKKKRSDTDSGSLDGKRGSVEEDSKNKLKKLLSKVAEKVAKRKKQSDRRRRKYDRQKGAANSGNGKLLNVRYLEDPDIEDDVNFLSRCGLKNQSDTLRFSRLMVRAKIVQTRLNLLKILRNGELPCRRLFLDYHGLRLLHGWMSEDDGNLEVRLAMLEALESLPIANKTVLTDSKVYQVVRSWCGNRSESGNENTVGNSLSSSDESSKESTNSQPKRVTSLEQELPLELRSLALKLTSRWDNLPEIFRIPKRERIEQMKEHEREADRQYAVAAARDEEEMRNNTSSNSDRYQRDRFGRGGGSNTQQRPHWSRGNNGKEARNISVFSTSSNSDPRRRGIGNDNIILSDGSMKHLSKKQRRELFAAKVARDEAEKRLAEERREFETKCRFFGLDPKKTRPHNMPFCVNPNTGQWYSADKKPISTPPSYAHVHVPSKAMSTNPADYQLPASALNLPINWKFAVTPQGKIYYYHVQHRIPQWEPPTPAQIHESATTQQDSANDSEGTDGGENDSSDDDVEVIKDMDAEQLKAYVEQKVKLRRIQRYNSLVGERSISPRREEDRIYNQIEVRKYKENKEKIRKRKEEIRRRRIESLKNATLNLSTLGGLDEALPATGSVTPNTKEPIKAENDENEALPIQDYLLSSDEEESINAECNNSPLLDKIVQGDKIVDELDALTTKRPLKRTLPPHGSISAIFPTNEISSATAITSTVERSEHHKKRKLEKRDSSRSGKKSRDHDHKYRKMKEKFRCEIAGIIVHHLKPYRKDSCLIGRIQNNEDFNHLAKKLTHFVMIKELKYCESVGQTLIVTESVKNKSREFIKKYMAKYGDVYVKPDNDPHFKDIPFML